MKEEISKAERSHLKMEVLKAQMANNRELINAHIDKLTTQAGLLVVLEMQVRKGSNDE